MREIVSKMFIVIALLALAFSDIVLGQPTSVNQVAIIMLMLALLVK